MTNKPMLSVERELLERFVSDVEAHNYGFNGLEELRALLDEPDEPFNLQGWSIDHSAGRPILMHNKCSVIEAEQAYGLLNLIETADQHQNSNPGWPDPLESTLAKEIINNPSAFDLAIRDLFDKLCREIQAGRYYRRFSGSEPMEFTANQGEPVAQSEFEHDAICEEADGCPTEGAVLKRFWRENQTDPVLCEFYEAESLPSLVRELVAHVAQLQEAAKRNVKPWEDTFPPTLLPAYIARLNAEQLAPVADHTQCEECKGWGYHENHHEGGGTECGECGGSGKAPVSVVMPEPYSLAMFQMISGFESVTPEQFELVWSACREEVSRLNGIKP